MSRGLPWLDKQAAKKLTRSVPIDSLDSHDIPEAPGVYIMQAKAKKYVYPWRTSSVFYIGKGDSLRNRLNTHRRFILQISENRADERYPYYWPVYEYAGYHGCMICWITCKQLEDARKLENNMLWAFARYCGTKPVGNSKGAWERKKTSYTPERRLLNEVFNTRGRSGDVNSEGKETIRSVLSSLQPREREVLTLLFGLNEGGPMGPKQVGISLRLGLREVQQARSDAFRKLRQPYRARHLIAL